MPLVVTTILVSCALALSTSADSTFDYVYSVETSSEIAVDNNKACDAISQPLVVTHRPLGQITSPRYNTPDVYPEDHNCSYTLVAPEGYRIWIEVRTVKMDHGCESRLSFYDGISSNGTPIDMFCRWDEGRKFVSQRNVMHITFEGIVTTSRIAPVFSLWFIFVKPPQECNKSVGEVSCRHNDNLWHLVNLPNKCYLPKHRCDKVDFCGDGTDEEDCKELETHIPEFAVKCGTPAVQPVLNNLGFRIKGGRKAKHGSWPWQVSLRLSSLEPDDGHICGGVLINSMWILTAAHCFAEDREYNNPSLWTVHLGRYNKIFRNIKDEVVRYPEEIRYPPNWNISNLFQFDIALVKLNAPVPIDNPYVRPVCMPTFTVPVDEGTAAYVTGWGEVQGTGYDLVLKQAAVPVVPRKVCQAWHSRKVIGESVICAGYAEGGHDSCGGDSGGPLVVYNSDSQTWQLVGIVSYGGQICGSPLAPGIYTRVSYFQKWIQDTAGV